MQFKSSVALNDFIGTLDKVWSEAMIYKLYHVQPPLNWSMKCWPGENYKISWVIRAAKPGESKMVSRRALSQRHIYISQMHVEENSAMRMI